MITPALACVLGRVTACFQPDDTRAWWSRSCAMMNAAVLSYFAAHVVRKVFRSSQGPKRG